MIIVNFVRKFHATPDAAEIGVVTLRGVPRWCKRVALGKILTRVERSTFVATLNDHNCAIVRYLRRHYSVSEYDAIQIRCYFV